MALLERIEKGTKDAPRRILLYGTHGIGKSTFAAMSDKPVFIPTEDGLNGIQVDRFPLVKTLGEAIQALSELYSEKHPYRTVAVDSLDWLERLIWQRVCEERGKASIEDIGYAKGYVFALDHWRTFLAGLSALRTERGMTVILVAHAKIERFENPETDTYDRYVPQLHRTASALVQQWCDEVLFATYKVYTKQTEEGFERKRTQAIGTGERVIKTTERPTHLAKNRLALPDELPLDWSAFSEYVKGKGRK